MRMIPFLLLLFCLPTTSDGADGYRLVWQDEFEQARLDTSKWTIVVDGKGGGNQELQYYRKENIRIDKEPTSGAGCLVITAKTERYRFKNATSGRLSTQGRMSFRYGKLEARIKLPRTADGLWPAFWMLGMDYPNAVWPRCGEIDIVEMGNKDGIADGTQDRLFNGACHWGERFNHGKYPNYSRFSTHDGSLQNDFHTFTLIWDEQSIRMYVDLGQDSTATPYFQMPIEGDRVANAPANYFHKPFFVLFNLAVGGRFTQVRNIRGVTALRSGKAEMYVDYVRLYQQDNKNDLLLNH